MVYPLNAVASLLVLRNSRVPANQRGPVTAVSAFTPGVLGLALPLVAASSAQRGQGGRRLPPPAPRPPPAPTVARVPGVVGTAVEAATKTLTDWGFTAVRGEDVYSDDADGQVIAQHPPAGRLAPLNSVVTLRASRKGPPPAPVTEETEMTELKVIEDLVRKVIENQKASSAAKGTPTQTSTPAQTPYLATGLSGADDPDGGGKKK